MSYSQDIAPESLPTPPPEIKSMYKPTIGLGTGMFSFYGDYYKKHLQNPMTSRLGFDLTVSQKLNECLQANFYVLFGKLGANERTDTRNLNFESEIRLGGIGFTYNFGNFLSSKRIISPYISLGLESVEFLSKTDLFDKNGTKYYFWKDGSIRDIDESSTLAPSATMLARDYTYESDVRELDLDGFGKYPEHTLAIPFGAGVIMHISPRVDFKLGTTLHSTFTDYIDGVTEKSVGSRKGNAQNDKFLMTSFSMHYNLTWPKGALDTLPEGWFDGVDFLAIEALDHDEDGVMDNKDSCQCTPKGVPVDEKGCPLDDDKDGVPNYVDQEKNSPSGAIVNMEGVQLTDSLLAYNYRIYTDSTGIGAPTEYEMHGSMTPGFKGRPKKEYIVLLAAYKTGIAPELMTKYLSISDMGTTLLSDSSTAYSAGKYTNYYDAEKRKNQLSSDSTFANAKVGYFKDGKFIEANGPDAEPVSNGSSEGISNKIKKGRTPSGIPSAETDPNVVVFRVQLGAYQRQLSRNIFPGIADLVEIKTDDGLYKYMAGAYSMYNGAAERKTELAAKGYKEAFVAAYKGGKRVSLESQGVAPVLNDKKEPVKENIAEPGPPVNVINKGLVKFKVQLGIYKDTPPVDMQKKYDAIKDIKKETTVTGLSRYVKGEFDDYKSALTLKNELIKNGISDAFIIALFKGQYISVQEALELTK